MYRIFKQKWHETRAGHSLGKKIIFGLVISKEELFSELREEIEFAKELEWKLRLEEAV